MKTFRFRLIFFLLLLLPFILTRPVLSSTQVGGPILMDTTWHVSESPYIVVQNINIKQGATLTIEPGVVIKFDKASDGSSDSTYQMVIDGTLVARGTQENQIVFTSNSENPQSGDWLNLHFTPTSPKTVFETEQFNWSPTNLDDCTNTKKLSENQVDTYQSPSLKYDTNGSYVSGNILEYVTLEYASTAIYAEKTMPYVNNVLFQHNGTGIKASYSEPFVQDITETIVLSSGNSWLSEVFTDIFGGNEDVYVYVHHMVYHPDRVENASFIGNGESIVYGQLDHHPNRLQVFDSLFSDNTDECISAESKSDDNIYIKNCSFINNTSYWYIIKASHKGSGYITIQDCTFTNNLLKRYSLLRLYNNANETGHINVVGCTFTGNLATSAIDYESGHFTSGSLKIDSVLIQGNYLNKGISIFCYGAPKPAISNSTIAYNYSKSGDPKDHVDGIKARTPSLSITGSTIMGHSRYELKNSYTKNIDAENNYWGTADGMDINFEIYDTYDDSGLGEVLYYPYLSAPSDTAPPLMSDLSVILTDTRPETTVPSGRLIRVYGTKGDNRITLESGAEAELFNVAGSNTITIEADSSLFTVSRSGATVTFQGSDGTVLKIPATASVQTISFNDQTLTLTIYNNQVMLEEQVIGTGNTPI